MDHPILIAVIALILLGLIIFINIKNKKDRKDLENKLNNDYKKPRDEEGEADVDLKEE
jgi:hypothetical protein